MNHIYRLIWDELRGAYVAVAEIARRRGKRAGTVVRATAAFITIGGLPLSLHAMDATTLPSGAQVVAGDVTLSQKGANLTVHQDSQRAILNWNSFDIGSQANVRFEQPDAHAVALNRVLGGSPSQVLGGLSANGQVWLVNPNGVYFGKGAQVDVGGLVVSSLSISDGDFLAGRSRFAAVGNPGAVRNEGTIRAQGGVVAMLAPVVGNAGTIDAGQVGLAAGNQVALDFDRDGMLSLAVEKGALQAQIAQSGLIRGNNVMLSARSASALRSSVINMDGVVEASGLSARGGRILLDGGDTGQVEVSGRLDASSASGTGGRIDVLGDRLVLDGGAQLDASGTLGGGAIHVGGGWQGKDPSLHNATKVDVDGSVAVNAGATQAGDGGEVVFWSDDSTRFAGHIDIRGGAQGGNGGRAEVSGKQDLTYAGLTDARAARGATGDLLLDPANITVTVGDRTGSISGSTVTVADLEAQVANVTLLAGGSNGGYIHFDDLGSNGGDGRLTMQDNVALRLEVTSPDNNHKGDISFANASNTIEVFGSGYIYLQAGTAGGGSVGTSAVGVPNLIAHGTGNPADSSNAVGSFFGGPATVNAGTPGSGSVTILGADGITLGGTITTNGGYVRLWADSDNAGGGGMVVNQAISTTGGNLYISAGDSGNSIALKSDMGLGTGRLFFHKDGTKSAAPVTLDGLLDASGDVDITTAFTMAGHASIYTDGNINFGAVNINLNTGDGVLVLRANRIDWGSATLQNLSTASMRLEPYDKATDMVLGDADGFASAATLDHLPGIKNLTIGREDGTGTISVSGAYNFDANGSFELVNGTVDIDGSLSNTTGNIILTGDHINIRQAVTANEGAGKVTIRQSTAANELHLGGGLTNASIGQVTAATLEIGRSDGGNLVFDSDISTTATSVHLKSGQQVIGVAGGVSAANLAITAGGGATVSDDTFDFTTLALDLGGSSSITSSSADWGLGTVDGLTGLTIQPDTSSANVFLHAEGRLGLDSTLDFNDTASTLEVQSGSGFSAEGATLAGQSSAVMTFSLEDNTQPFELGGSGSTLSGAAMTRFNGVDTLFVDALGNALTVGAFDVDVGNRVVINANSLQQLGAMKAGSGGLYLSVLTGGLTLNQAITAAQTVMLRDVAGAGIQGNGTITADALALHSGGNVNLASGTHQIGRIAAYVGSLAFNNGGTLHVGSADGLDGIDAAGTVDLRATGASSDLVLDQAVHAGNAAAAGTAVQLAAGRNFINNAGATAVSADRGRWLVYSTSPLEDTRGGLAAEFKQYAAGLGDEVLDDGSGFLYTVAPRIGVELTGSADKTYDGNGTAAVDGIGLSLSGAIDGDTVVVDKGTAHYDDRNVGTGKTVTMDGLAIDEADNDGVRVYGYVLDGTSASGAIGNIDRKTIHFRAGSVQDKVYDRSTDASLGSVSLDGVVAGDAVAFAGADSVAFADRNAGSHKQVDIGGISLSGADAGNYVVEGVAYADIDKRVLTVDVGVQDKVYDGGTGASLSSQSLGNLVAGDDVLLDVSAAFTDKNVGNNKNVVVTASLDGDDAGNYVLDADTANPRASTASITRKTIDAGTLNVVGKTYDGNRDATVSSSGLVGVVARDDLSLQLSGQYDDRNAGTGKRVDVSLGLDGDDAGNYQLADTTVIASGDIARKTIDVGTLNVVGKTYDGTRDATVTSSGLVGVVTGDDLSLELSGLYDDRNAGTGKRVEVSLGLDGLDAGNYQLADTTVIASGDIARKTIDAGTLNVVGKTYDGNRDATVTSSGLVGVVAGDDLSLQLSGQYDDRNAGTGKHVDVSLGLDGDDAGNYLLARTTATSTGDIARKTIDAGTLNIVGKTYDGSRDATVTSSGLVGVVKGDDLSLQLSGRYDDRNAGTGKRVDVSLGLDGGDAGNYQLAETTATASGDIARKTIGAGTLDVVGKTYDGTRDATVHSSGLVGVVKGDDLSLQLRGQYDDKNAGTGKRVDVSLGLDGDDAGNYRLSSTTAQARGDVAAKDLVVGVVGVADKRFDGSRDAELVLPALHGVVGGDDVVLHGQGSFDTAGTGANKTVQIALSLSGDDAANYRLVDAHQQAVAGISDLPGRNAVDAISQPSLGSNGTRPGTSDAGAGNSPGAVAASAGAMGDLTGSAQPQLGDSRIDPTGMGSTAAGQGTGAGSDGLADSGNAGGNGGDGSRGAGNGTGAVAGAAGTGAADAGSDGAAGNVPADAGMEQMLRNGGSVSLSLGGEALAEPQVSVLPMFTEDGRQVGRYRVDDLGDSLALHPVTDARVAAPDLQQPVRARAATRVRIDEGHTGSLRMELLEDGTLHIVASTGAAQLGRDALAAYALGTLKRQAGVSPQQVKALVLGFAD